MSQRSYTSFRCIAVKTLPIGPRYKRYQTTQAVEVKWAIFEIFFSFLAVEHCGKNVRNLISKLARVKFCRLRKFRNHRF